MRAQEDLLSPAASVEVAALTRLWRWDEATVICERPRDLEEQPDFALRVRGAVGRQLRLRALDRPRRDPWGRPSAWTLLYDLEPPRRDGFEVARPFTVRAVVSRDRVVATIRLFGWAGMLVEEVGEALWMALQEGVSLRAGGRRRVAFPPLEVAITRTEGLRVPDACGHVDLLLDTPTVIRKGDRLTLDPKSVPMAAVRRVTSLAPWMEVRLVHDERALAVAAGEASYDLEGLVPASWIRFSIRNPDAPIPVYAFRGRIRMAGRLTPLAPYLALAETCGLGSHAALGFGNVRAILY